jgi:hypothetical protein
LNIRLFSLNFIADMGPDVDQLLPSLASSALSVVSVFAAKYCL